MLKLKVCGMRDQDNVQELIKLSPDFIGFIFHEGSPRNIIEFPGINIPESIHKTGVFVNKSVNYILSVCKDHNLNCVQLHGQESPNICKRIKSEGLKVIKAFNIRKDFDFSILGVYENSCDYLLFDAFGKYPGGNNITFDWDIFQDYNGTTPFLLSGGIKPELLDKIKAISHKNFAGVDINSGFEVQPGLKNIELIKKFKDELFSR